MARRGRRKTPGAPGDYWKHDRTPRRPSFWRRLFGKRR